MSDARKDLERIAAQPDERIDLAEAALLIAKEEYPELDVAGYVARLEDLARAARDEIRDDLPAADKIARLNHFLFVEQSFRGNENDYYDPRNSFLNEVLDRRTGIPITLSVVYTEIARRLGLPVSGVGFPGHFLVKHVGDPEILIDPFFGGTISREDCAERLRSIVAPDEGEEEEEEEEPPDLEPEMLRPATAREIVVRMLRNLKQIYVSRDDHVKALSCVERILLFVPEDPEEIRDRGILYLKLECWGSALRDLETFLERRPADESAEAIREALPDLRREVGRYH